MKIKLWFVSFLLPWLLLIDKWRVVDGQHSRRQKHHQCALINEVGVRLWQGREPSSNNAYESLDSYHHHRESFAHRSLIISFFFFFFTEIAWVTELTLGKCLVCWTHMGIGRKEGIEGGIEWKRWQSVSLIDLSFPLCLIIFFCNQNRSTSE